MPRSAHLLSMSLIYITMATGDLGHCARLLNDDNSYPKDDVSHSNQKSTVDFVDHLVKRATNNSKHGNDNSNHHHNININNNKNIDFTPGTTRALRSGITSSLEYLKTRLYIFGSSQLCRRVCSFCRQVTGKRLAALCPTHCPTGGMAFVACLTFWSIRDQFVLVKTETSRWKYVCFRI